MHQLAKGLEFQLQHHPSNEYSGLISFRTDWFDLLALQGTLKSLLQQHSSKASVLQHSAFFVVQPSHPYKTTRKIIALTRQTFVGKEMSLLFNMLSRDFLVVQWLRLWVPVAESTGSIPSLGRSHIPLWPSSVQSLSRVRLFASQ